MKTKASDLNLSHRSDSQSFPGIVSPEKIKPHLVRAEGSLRKNILTLGKIVVEENKKSTEKTIKAKTLVKHENLIAPRI